MTTAEVANELVQLCRQGQFGEAITKLYADNIVSVEAGGPMAEMTGIEACKGKMQWWEENHEVHEVKVGGPYVNGDQFIVEFTMDVTPKATGTRTADTEMGVYTVAGGKIVHEKFFPAG